MLDVIVTSTCRKTIIPTMKSFLKRVFSSQQYRFIVNIDVRNPAYLPKLKQFLADMNIDVFRVNMSPKPWPRGLTETTNFLYTKVETPYYFSLQDDWLFLRTINLDPLIEVMNHNPYVDHIRLSKQRIRPYAWLYHLSGEDVPKYRKPNIEMAIDNINLVRTHNWSFNPSLSRTSVMKTMLPVPVRTRAETHFCLRYDQLYSTRGAYVLGRIGDKPAVRDIGRNRYREYFRRLKTRLLRATLYERLTGA